MRMSIAAVMVSLGISENSGEKKRTMHFDYRLKGGAVEKYPFQDTADSARLKYRSRNQQRAVYWFASRPPALRRSITPSCGEDILGQRRRWSSATRALESSRMQATPVLRWEVA